MFTDTDGNGQPEALQEDHYYPFGLKMADGAMQPSQPTVHLYNGKELQDELGLGWYDYGARMYSPTVGRWNGVDQLAEKYKRHTPYSYTLGNPIVFIDPDGRSTSVGQIIANAWYATPEDGKATFTASQREEERSSEESSEETTSETSSQSGEEANCCPPWMLHGARAALAGMATDVAIPDPSDAVPHKWASYGVTALIAGTIILMATGDDAPDIPIDIPSDEVDEDDWVTVYSTTDLPLNLNRQSSGPTGSSPYFGGTYVTEKDLTNPATYAMHVGSVVPWAGSRRGQYPEYLTRLLVPRSSLVPDPSDPTAPVGNHWLPPGAAAAITRVYRVTEAEDGVTPVITPITP